MRGQNQIKQKYVEDALARRFAMDAARTLSEYHIQFVQPVIVMAEYLALPWWRRIFTKKPTMDFDLRPVKEVQNTMHELYGVGEPVEEEEQPDE